MYGSQLVNAQRVLNAKLNKSKPNPQNLTLAERILINRQRGGNAPQREPQRDDVSGSVDISDLTNQPEDKRSPTPEPTRTRRSPVKKQESRRTLISQDPGPSKRKSETPHLPPITPRSVSKTQRVDSRQNTPNSRKETPVLPPITRSDSRKSKDSNKSDPDIIPPEDRRHFDQDIGVGDDISNRGSPPARNVTPKQPEARVESVANVQKTVDTGKSERVRSPKVVEKVVESSTAQVAPVVVAAAATKTEGSRLQSRERSRSRTKSRSRSMSRSRSREMSPKKTSRSRSRSRKKERKRRARSASSYSRSKSHSRHRSRRSRSRKRYRSTSSSYSSSPRRHRRRSYSPYRRHKSRGRSSSRRRSFDYDFERAKSIIRSLSRMDTFTRPRPRSPSIEYTILGGQGGMWSEQRPYSSKKKKKIIIVQNGSAVKPIQNKRRNDESSDSDISIIVKGPDKSKKKGTRQGKVRKVSPSESSDSDEAKKKQSKKNNESEVSESETDSDDKKKKQKVKQSKSKKKKNIRFDLKGGKKESPKYKKKLPDENKSEDKKQSSDEDKSDSENEAIVETIKPDLAMVDKQAEVASVPKRVSPLISPAFNNMTPNQLKKQPNSSSNRRNNDDDQALLEALEQLDKRSDFELEQLKGGNMRKLPPDVNLDMKKKIFSQEFQNNINAFLQS